MNSQFDEDQGMQSQNDAAKVRFFPPGIPLIAILSGLGLQRLLPLHFGVAVSDELRYLVGGVMALGAILIVVLFRRGGQNENPWKPTPAIETRGPFRVTRNPMYLQMLIVCIGASFAFANWWILLLTPIVAFALQRLAIEAEEAYLEDKFGETYREYKQKVRRWF